MSCVRPGVLLTKARRRRPARALIALDFPAFERPAKATSGAPGLGSSRGSCTDIVKVAAASGNSLFAAARVAGEGRPTLKSPGLALPLPPSFSRGF